MNVSRLADMLIRRLLNEDDRRAYWMAPDLTLHEVFPGETHGSYAGKKLGTFADEATTEFYRKGYIRIVINIEEIMFEYRPDIRRPSNAQRKEINDLAIEGHRKIFDGTTGKLYDPE